MFIYCHDGDTILSRFITILAMIWLVVRIFFSGLEYSATLWPIQIMWQILLGTILSMYKVSLKNPNSCYSEHCFGHLLYHWDIMYRFIKQEIIVHIYMYTVHFSLGILKNLISKFSFSYKLHFERLSHIIMLLFV